MSKVKKLLFLQLGLKKQKDILMPPAKTKRLIGQIIGAKEGPTVVFIAGLHGNEPAGIIALEQAFKTLEKKQAEFKGNMYGLAGNLRALEQKERFIDKDLNRVWGKEKEINEEKKGKIAEIKEKQELQAEIDVIIARHPGLCIFIDLHTTSAPSQPFIIMSDTIINRNVVKNFPIPVIIGSEEFIAGPIMHYLNEKGYIAFAFEAGQHESPKSIKNHYALIFYALSRVGHLPPNHILVKKAKSVLKEESGSLRGMYEIRYRHTISEEEKFTMLPGFHNFQAVKKRQLLAKNQYRNIVALQKGLMFMPLYQKQGEDGFFLIRKIGPIWLSLSYILRKLAMYKLVRLFPGIKTYKGSSKSLIVNRKIAKWFTIEIMHLLGYRRKKRVPEGILFVRRKYDLKGKS